MAIEIRRFILKALDNLELDVAHYGNFLSVKPYSI